MSSQSAQHRTTAKPTGLPPVNASLREPTPTPEPERVSWWWLPAILAGAYALFVYVVPFSANLLLDLFH